MDHGLMMNGVNRRHMTLVTGLCNSSVSLNISNKAFMKYYLVCFLLNITVDNNNYHIVIFNKGTFIYSVQSSGLLNAKGPPCTGTHLYS